MLSPSPSVSPTESPSISPPPKASPSPTVLPLLGDKGADTECDVVSANTALAADIAARYTCYNISTSDVIFDCAGHTVTGNTSGYGFNISNAHNVVIKNCVIVNFTRGVSADNAINLTLLNNTYVNITGIEAYGIYVGNSSRSNFTSQVLRDFKPLISGSNGYLAYGVYMYNVSSSSINYVHLLRISGGNSSADTRRGGAVFGFYLYRSNNDSFAHTWFESLEAGKPVLIAASGAGGPGGNITGIRLFSSNNSYFQNTTLNGIVGTTGSGGATSSAAGSGGLGGVAIGIHSVLSFNCVFNSTSMQNITAGNGGNGGDRTTSAGNGGFGGVGGNSIPLFFESAQNFTFPNLTILNVTAGNGGSGGDGYTTGQAGNGGNAGSAYAIFLSRSQASAFTSASIRNILAGRGGVSGSSTAFVKTDVGGNGGNSSFILQEITTNLNFSDFTTNSSLANVGGAGTTDGIGGRGSGAFFYASNSTLMNRVCLQNVSSISDKDATEGSIGGVYFFDSTQNEIANSTIDIIHELAASYAVYSNKEAWNNVFVNTTFNRTSNGWGGVAGTKNFTLKWYVRVRVHDLSEGPIEGASIDIYNSTDSDVPMVVGSTDSAGYLNGIVLTEYIANGSYAYVGSCSTGDNINCYTPHNFSVIKAAYNDYSENVTIDVSSMGLHFGLTLAPLPHTSFTLTLPGITNPVESSDSVPPDAPFTAIMNFTLNVSANVEGTQGNVTPCVGKSHVNCQNETMPFFNFTNTGKVNLNWSIKFNITLPASIVFKCHNTNNAGSALVVANSSFNDYVQVNNASVAPGDSELAWCWADFNLAQAGVTIGRLDTNSSDGG